jgi:hypothetical protein
VDAEVRRRLLAAREAAGGICVCVAVRAGPLYKQVTAVKTLCILHIQNNLLGVVAMAIDRRFYLLNVVEEIEIGCRGGDDERKRENGDGEGAVEGLCFDAQLHSV